MRAVNRRWIVTTIAILVLAAGALWFLAGERPASDHEKPGEGEERADPMASPATYVGREVCAECHQREHDLWTDSHHDLAMQVANETTVLGNFNNATITHFGVTSTFYSRGGKFFVRTDGPHGTLEEYEVLYTFGVAPLQQYLVELPGGRYQALSLAWDSRPKGRGGQRWFHLYPLEKIAHDDALHWTGRNQNWNFMCADCHSTNLQKKYDLKQDEYLTSWSEIDVSCEACHGPGSRHSQWAKERDSRIETEQPGSNGLLVQLREREPPIWAPDPKKGTAKRVTPRVSHDELETCAQCHSRRAVIHDAKIPGRPFLDSYLPVLLEPNLYHADGQIDGEVYEYGSFLQSKMYRAGVTCSDCHEPHSLNIRAPGNALCIRCHAAERFDRPEHSFHKPASTGAQCVACHMPEKTYMVVDQRRDHSIRIPRPDLTVQQGTPNACTQCHRNKSAQWAAGAIAKWYGQDPRYEPHYGQQVYAGQKHEAGAAGQLAMLARDKTQPAIVRATGLSLLREHTNRPALDAIQEGLVDRDPIVRVGALRGLESLAPAARMRLAETLLSDPLRSVRLEAAQALAPVPRTDLTVAQQTALNRATVEYIDAQLANAERPEAHVNLGTLYRELGRLSDAEDSYRTALRLAPIHLSALVNLADLYRLQQHDDRGEPLLREAARVAPDNPNVHQALGFLLVRQGRQAEALGLFEKAARLRPQDPSNSYIYGLALNSSGQTPQALTVLDAAHRRHPKNGQILQALATINWDIGRRNAAIRHAEQLVALVPEEPEARQLLEHLRSSIQAP
jgi:predicted CXXCH cytochrome family protein